MQEKINYNELEKNLMMRSLTLLNESIDFETRVLQNKISNLKSKTDMENIETNLNSVLKIIEKSILTIKKSYKNMCRDYKSLNSDLKDDRSIIELKDTVDKKYNEVLNNFAKKIEFIENTETKNLYKENKDKMFKVLDQIVTNINELLNVIKEKEDVEETKEKVKSQSLYSRILSWVTFWK